MSSKKLSYPNHEVPKCHLTLLLYSAGSLTYVARLAVWSEIGLLSHHSLDRVHVHIRTQGEGKPLMHCRIRSPRACIQIDCKQRLPKGRRVQVHGTPTEAPIALLLSKCMQCTSPNYLLPLQVTYSTCFNLEVSGTEDASHFRSKFWLACIEGPMPSGPTKCPFVTQILFPKWVADTGNSSGHSRETVTKVSAFPSRNLDSFYGWAMSFSHPFYLSPSFER